MNIVSIIQQELDRRGWTQKELALRAGIAAATINHIMTGRIVSPTVFTLWRIAKALGLTLNDLTEESGAYGVRR